MTYDSRNHLLVQDWKIPGRTAGTETLVVTIRYPNTSVTKILSAPIVITK